MIFQPDMQLHRNKISIANASKDEKVDNYKVEFKQVKMKIAKVYGEGRHLNVI